MVITRPKFCTTKSTVTKSIKNKLTKIQEQNKPTQLNYLGVVASHDIWPENGAGLNKKGKT